MKTSCHRIQFLTILSITLWTSMSASAILHFYTNPRVPQALYHVGIETKGIYFEADAPKGAIKKPVSQMKNQGDAQVFVADSLLDREVLEDQIGQEFDYEFIWNDDKAYCSEFIGLALNIPPYPMDFRGTHYLKYYPEWAYRNDPGLSPDQLWLWALRHGTLIKNEIAGLPNQDTHEENPRFLKAPAK